MEKIKNVLQSIFLFFVKILYNFLNKEFDEETKIKWNQFLGFCLVGLSNFGVNYIVYACCLKVLNLNYHISNVIAFIISVFNAFYWNNKFVFKGESDLKNTLYSLLKTYISYAITGLFLTEILLVIEVDVIGLPELSGPIINLFITTPINFLLNKYWAFGNKQ